MIALYSVQWTGLFCLIFYECPLHRTVYRIILLTLYSVFYDCPIHCTVYKIQSLYIVQCIIWLSVHCTVYFTLWCTGLVPYTQYSLPSRLLVWVSGVVETTAVLSSESEISYGVHRSLSWCWVLQSIKKTDNQVTDLITMSVCHVTYNQATDLITISVCRVTYNQATDLITMSVCRVTYNQATDL